MERTAQYYKQQKYQGIPVPIKKAENREKLGQNREDTLVEWEKNTVKDFWNTFDTDKQGLQVTQLKEIILKLKEDKCIIGKVPALEDHEIESVFESWEITEEKPCTWVQFREGMNCWIWRLQDRQKLQKMIDDFFALSLKYKMQGKDEECQQMATNALRLEGSLTKCTPIEVPQRPEPGLPKRGDWLTVKVHRRVDQDPNLLLPNDDFNDLTKTFKFNK
jgi:hypothetical protein